MVVIGLVIILIALVLGVAGVLGGTDTVRLDLGVGHVTMSASAVFLLGALALLLLVIGLGTMRVGFRRAREHRQDRRRVNRLSRELDKARHDAGMDQEKRTSDDVVEDDTPRPI
ncbi:hypothetical protein D9V37_19765 [Nocardioides mangrovicus]|uniref:DUF1049 domain-containing protein n=1 Tax=Nocardioides mangrovicus TaxID=2478913 RepID=A0A3L8P0G4_9ACTN|nr:hypothetical protein [Nocardioides mangrovicus]RLV48283.1 hypothetical protein D9V37_19765 [Nocardioides mangrovicus]